MFKSAESRYVLRSSLAGVAAADASLVTAALNGGIGWDDGVIGLLLGVGSALAYAGIGAATKPVEPNIGNTMPVGEGLARPTTLSGQNPNV